MILRAGQWHAPATVDLREGTPSLILQSPKFFALVDGVGALQVYSYDGRAVSSPKLPATVRAEQLTASGAAISDDTLAVRDAKDPRTIHVFDLLTGSPLGKPVAHPLEVTELALDQVE